MDSSSASSGRAPRPRWLTVLGTVEGYVAAGLMVVVFFLPPVSPGNQVHAMIIFSVLAGLGLGLGVGGIRFGDRGGKVAGWTAVIMLSLLCVLVLVVDLVKGL